MRVASLKLDMIDFRCKSNQMGDLEKSVSSPVSLLERNTELRALRRNYAFDVIQVHFCLFEGLIGAEILPTIAALILAVH